MNGKANAASMISDNSNDWLYRRAWADGSDRSARMNMLLGSLYAGMAFSNSPCAAVHALAYPIGNTTRFIGFMYIRVLSVVGLYWETLHYTKLLNNS